MGKAKKEKSRQKAKPHPYAKKPHKSQIPPRKTPKSRQLVSQRQLPTIPFNPGHRILLVGEGDFSFALSLHSHHDCTSLTATTPESRTSLLSKHPQASQHIKALEDAGHRILYTIDGMKLGSPHGGGGNAIRSTAWDRIVFNFPHTGGLTKDVNRQVRANQELLVRFFEAAKPFLAPGGVVVVTVFEGQPYELWNLRDLGRHVGMRVGRSFRFPAEAYPGYRHARTLGNVEGGGGWRGEERPARTYCFEVPGDDGGGPVEKRRKGGDDEDENEGED